MRTNGESLQSSVFQTKGGKDGWAGRATAEEARRSAETRDWMPTMVLWEMGGEKRSGTSSRGRVKSEVYGGGSSLRAVLDGVGLKYVCEGRVSLAEIRARNREGVGVRAEAHRRSFWLR